MHYANEPNHQPGPERHGFRLFFATALPALVIYLWTVAPTVTAEDSGELITSAYTLGIAHPPGYPLWCILGKVFTYLPFGTIAWRVNLLSAVLGAISAGVLSLIAYRFTGRFAISLIAGLVFAFSRDFWSQCVITEVYTLNTLFVLLILFLLFRYEDTWKTRWLYLASFALGLGLTNHSTLGPLGIFFAGWLFMRHLRLLLRPLLLVNLLAAFLLGLAIVLYLPIRSTAEPLMNWGNPESLTAFLDHVLRRQYSDAVVPQARTIAGQAVLIWHFLGTFAGQFTVPLAAFAVAGAVVHLKRELSTFVLFGVLFGLTSYGFIWLFNYPPDRENLYLTQPFFLPAHAVSAVWIAIALHEVADRMSPRLAGIGGDLRIAGGLVGACLVLLPLLTNYTHNDMSRNRLAEDWGRNILESLKPYAIIIPSADHSTFPLIYLQAVEEVRPDVLIADKYGYIDDRILRDLFRYEHPPQSSPPLGGNPFEKQKYLIEQTGRPVYFTTKMRIPEVQNHEMVTFGLVFEAVRKGEKPKEEKHRAAWEKIRFQPGSLAREPGHFSEDLILSDYHYALGRYHLLFSRCDEALQELRIAERYGFGIKEIHNNLGGTLAEGGRAEDALPFLRNALSVDPDYDMAIRNLANALFSLGRNQDGLPFYERSIEIEPENPLPYLGKARALKEAGKKIEAYVSYCQALQFQPRNDGLRKELKAFAESTYGKDSVLAKGVPERPETMRPGYMDGEEDFNPGAPAGEPVPASWRGADPDLERFVSPRRS